MVISQYKIEVCFESKYGFIDKTRVINIDRFY